MFNRLRGLWAIFPSQDDVCTESLWISWSNRNAFDLNRENIEIVVQGIYFRLLSFATLPLFFRKNKSQECLKIIILYLDLLVSAKQHKTRLIDRLSLQENSFRECWRKKFKKLSQFALLRCVMRTKQFILIYNVQMARNYAPCKLQSDLKAVNFLSALTSDSFLVLLWSLR